MVPPYSRGLLLKALIALWHRRGRPAGGRGRVCERFLLGSCDVRDVCRLGIPPLAACGLPGLHAAWLSSGSSLPFTPLDLTARHTRDLDFVCLCWMLGCQLCLAMPGRAGPPVGYDEYTDSRRFCCRTCPSAVLIPSMLIVHAVVVLPSISIAPCLVSSSLSPVTPLNPHSLHPYSHFPDLHLLSQQCGGNIHATCGLIKASPVTRQLSSNSGHLVTLTSSMVASLT